MTKHSLFIRIIIIIWVIVLFRLCLPPYVLWDNILEFGSSFIDFKFTFSFSHFLNLTAACIFLYFIRNWIYDHDKKVQLSAMMRYLNTLKDHDSFFVKLFIVVFPISIMIFTFSAIYKFTQIPEILFLIILFTIIGFFEFKKDPKAPDNFEKNIYLFTDDPIKKYSQLNDFQRTEVNQLKSILDAGLEEYLSIALNGSWGSGKTSILNGLKNLLENGYPESENFKSNYEVFELNLWQARTPENAIDELDRLFTELFNKVYLNVSSNDLAFFSLLSGSENSWLSTSLKTLLGDNDSMPTSQKRLNAKLEQVLNRLKKQKLVILIDDLDRLPEQYLNGFLKIICYVTGLKNVVTISGINREKILSILHKAEELTVLADGLNIGQKFAKEKNKNENIEIDILRRKSNKTNEAEEKKVFHFTKFDNESFISKIFTVQRELVNSNYHIKSFADINIDNMSSFQVEIELKDKEDIKNGITGFIEKNKNCFNTYRDIKLFLNEVFIYLICFGGKKQSEIKIADYINIDSVLSMAWAKVVYPDFYKKVQDYITPFMSSKQRINKGNELGSTYDFALFINTQFQYFDDGKEQTPNTRAHHQIKQIFDQSNNDASFKNPDAGIKYFHPIIEPYEYTTVEFSKLFDEKPDDENIIEFLKPNWNKDSTSVLIDFIRRLKLRKFEIYERLNSALALVSFDIPSNFWPNSSNREEVYWLDILRLLDNINGSEDNTKTFIDIQVEDNEITRKFLNLWELKFNCLGMHMRIEFVSLDYKNNLFYKFFNQSDFQNQDDKTRQTYYKLLFKEIAQYSFKSAISKVACLVYVYELTMKYWEENLKDTQKRVMILDGLDTIYLDAFFSLLPKKDPLPEYFFKDFPLIFNCVRLKHDKILFKSDNLNKLIHLFENKNIDFDFFMDRLIDRTDRCLLSVDQAKNAREKLLAYIKAESDYFGKGYEETIEKFFKPKVTANEIDESRLSEV